MTAKQISQLVTEDGKAAATATSAPGWFIHDGTPVKHFAARTWGNTFAPPRAGNKVEFYVTGEEYFNKVAAAFLSATKTIYITGWQVNFDVTLANGKTLFEHLETAMTANPQLKVYIMPWLSPKVGVDTFDFETMLAIFQLNAGMPGPPPAFVLPAIAQSDQKAGLAIGFSHHQKLVVVDGKTAFVGGIDLAYGRRDNGKFLLRADWRKGNELYNTCIPAIHEMSKKEQVNLLTRWELLSACFGGASGWLAEWWFSASGTPVALAKDALHSGSETVADANKHVSNWWESSSIMPAFLDEWKKLALERAEKSARTGYHELDRKLGGRLEFLRTSATAYVPDAAAAMVAWLNNASLEALPAEIQAETSTLIQTFMITMVSYLHAKADKLDERYDNLKQLRKMLPAGGVVLAPSQPRMPWHDVHSSIEGPSVSDLCRNFERRWNGVAASYEGAHHSLTSNPTLKLVFDALHMKPIAAVKLPRIAPSAAPETHAKAGRSWVQVLRSAPLHLQRDEAKALKVAAPAAAQDNCMKAIVNAIMGAQHFIYIEGQFFQSAYGDDRPGKTSAFSGPMAALIDIAASPLYKKYMKILGIENVPLSEIPAKIRWAKAIEISGEREFAGFKRDLNAALKNVAAIKASQLMGQAQQGIENPVSEAIGRSVESALCDGRKFHVYMVIPVHPEGTLNTLNIMTQLHLTMQSLVFGEDSLVNRIRRAIAAGDLRKRTKLDYASAMKEVAQYSPTKLRAEVGVRWQQHLTLLNLRNWELLENRPVTEQIYVHSKLVIVDDRVAILGSANLNDRSLLGNRDSELAVMVRDDEQVQVKLNGIDNQPVSANVHNLRVRLWQKIFGLMGSSAPATDMISVLHAPAAPSTWRAVQQLAEANAEAYQHAFPFVARLQGKSSSIWPAWNVQQRCLDTYMPFNSQFWRPEEVRDESFTWDAKRRAAERPPTGVRGFIVALPISWTEGENNLSGMNLTLLANIDKKPAASTEYAALNADTSANSIDIRGNDKSHG